MELYREINFSHSESWGIKRGRDGRRLLKQQPIVLHFVSHFKCDFHLFKYCCWQAPIYINLNIPYFLQKLFKCLMEKILLQCGELFNPVCY